MVVGGVPVPVGNHAQRVANFALGMRTSAREVMNPVTREPIQVDGPWVLCLLPTVSPEKQDSVSWLLRRWSGVVRGPERVASPRSPLPWRVSLCDTDASKDAALPASPESQQTLRSPGLPCDSLNPSPLCGMQGRAGHTPRGLAGLKPS